MIVNHALHHPKEYPLSPSFPKERKDHETVGAGSVLQIPHSDLESLPESVKEFGTQYLQSLFIAEESIKLPNDLFYNFTSFDQTLLLYVQCRRIFFNVLVDTPTENTSDSKEPNPETEYCSFIKRLNMIY